MLLDQNGAQMGASDQKLTSEGAQAAQLQAVAAASHVSIYDNHNPLRVKAMVEAISAVKGANHADILMTVAMLLANVSLLHDQHWRFSAQLGVFSHVKTMIESVESAVPEGADG
jgi:hypothetical protein